MSRAIQGARPQSSLLLSRRSLLGAGARVAAVGLAAPLIARFSPAAAAFPDRPIKLVVPFGPGGPVDVVARLIAEPLAKELGGANVFIENRPGASSNLGMGIVARSDPDGYTVLIAASNLVINPILTTKLPFDVEKDFLPLVDIADTPGTFSIRNDLGVKTLPEFIELAKKSGKFSYSHAGFGTVAHLSAEYFKQKTGIDMAAVSHNGSGPAVQSLLSGAVEFCSAGLPALHGHYGKKTVTPIGILSEKRWFDLPDVPTATEAGLPGFVFGNFNAMLVPAKTPPEIADKLSSALLTALKSPEAAARFRPLGAEIVAGGPQQLSERIAREIPMWRNIARLSGIKPTES